MSSDKTQTKRQRKNNQTRSLSRVPITCSRLKTIEEDKGWLWPNYQLPITCGRLKTTEEVLVVTKPKSTQNLIVTSYQAWSATLQFNFYLCIRQICTFAKIPAQHISPWHTSESSSEQLSRTCSGQSCTCVQSLAQVDHQGSGPLGESK